jgi:glyoxylase-like metal-dependent hydrolase (beta-lactamase superfamily II)
MKKSIVKRCTVIIMATVLASTFAACSSNSSRNQSQSAANLTASSSENNSNENGQGAKSWTPVKSIDFSSKHDVMIKNDDGSLTPMDEPYFKSTLIAPGTWQILSDGDYCYLVEGDNEALMIDCGYGAGNIREYAQSLTEKPIKNVVNTHYHFDHTANDAYFDCAYMSADTVANATIPGPSFEGINFPQDYPKVVIGEGYKFDLGNRELEVFEIPNHTPGGIALLDRRERILFSGDEIIMDKNVTLNCSVTQFEQNMSKIAAHRSEFDKLCGGFTIVDASAVDKFLANAQYILSGQGTPQKKQSNMGQGQQPASTDPSAQKVYVRHMPHPEDMGDMSAKAANENLVQMTYDDCTITYDSSKIKD